MGIYIQEYQVESGNLDSYKWQPARPELVWADGNPDMLVGRPEWDLATSTFEMLQDASQIVDDANHLQTCLTKQSIYSALRGNPHYGQSNFGYSVSKDVAYECIIRLLASTFDCQTIDIRKQLDANIRNPQSGFVDMAILLWPLWILLATFGFVVSVSAYLTGRDIRAAKRDAVDLSTPDLDVCMDCGMWECTCNPQSDYFKQAAANAAARARRELEISNIESRRHNRICRLVDIESAAFGIGNFDVANDECTSRELQLAFPNYTGLQLPGCIIGFDFVEMQVYIQFPNSVRGAFGLPEMVDATHKSNWHCCTFAEWVAICATVHRMFARYKSGNLIFVRDGRPATILDFGKLRDLDTATHSQHSMWQNV